MGGAWKLFGDLLRDAGGCLMGMGGFSLDADGRLIEEYDDTEEDWPEEREASGDESQDGEDLGWTDCVWSDSECDRA